MCKEVYIVTDENLEYVAKVNLSKIKLRRSNSHSWSSNTRGEDAGTLKDTGNNIKINIDGEKIKLNYGQFEQLKHLISLKISDDPSYNNDDYFFEKI